MTSAASTPERRLPAASSIPHHVRRVVTLPPKLADPASTAQAARGPETIEWLLHIEFARIVAFESSSSRPNSRSNTRAASSTAVRWTSPTETTLATGSLGIYRASNTGVSFLHSGASFLRPILKRSQCWCVDDVSTFVLKGREDSFYRFELPNSTASQKEDVEKFKRVIATLLRYEKTPCPFRDGFEDVPETPPTPVRRHSLQPRSRAKKWRLNKVWEPEDSPLRAVKTPSAGFQPKDGPPSPTRSWNAASEVGTRASNRSTSDVIDWREKSLAGPPPGLIPDVQEPRDIEHPSLYSAAKSADDLTHTFRTPLPKHLLAIRSATAPPQLTTHASPPSKSLKSLPSISRSIPPSNPVATPAPSTLSPLSADDADTASISSSHDSFYSATSVGEGPSIVDHTAPPAEDFEFVQMPLRPPPINTHTRNISIGSSTIDTPRAVTSGFAAEPSTPTLISDASSNSDGLSIGMTGSPPTTIRLRHAKQCPDDAFDEAAAEDDPVPRKLSILSPTIPAGFNPIGAALIQKTYSLLIGPPAHLIALMLQIAARIVHRLPQGATAAARIPGAWESGDGDGYFDEDEDEDDFGFPLHHAGVIQDVSMAYVDASMDAKAWEVD